MYTVLQLWTHLYSIMKYFIKNINEDFISYWLQTVGAVITIRSSEELNKSKKWFEQYRKMRINLHA